jgi:hypothetical protein
MAASEGVDLEWAIVDMCRIEMGEQEVTKKEYSAKIKSQASQCVKHLKSKLGNEFEIYHSDEKVPGIGRPIYAKPEPKTDIVVISKGKNYFISVKMAGGIQLASGQGASTAELFESAAHLIDNQNEKKVLLSIVETLKNMPTRLLSDKNFSRIVSEGNAKIVEEFIKDGKIVQDKRYEYWLENNKHQLLGSLLKFVQVNNEYYNAIIYEALTGSKTLQKYKGAVANSILSPSGFYDINDAYVNKIKSKIKMDLRAKSRGGISSIAFRIETKGSV